MKVFIYVIVSLFTDTQECEPYYHPQIEGSGIPVVIRMKYQLTPAGIYVSRLHSGASSIYATAGEAAFKLVPYYSEFSRFSIGSKPNRSPQCCRSLLIDATKIGIFSETCYKMVRNLSF